MYCNVMYQHQWLSDGHTAGVYPRGDRMRCISKCVEGTSGRMAWPLRTQHWAANQPDRPDGALGRPVSRSYCWFALIECRSARLNVGSFAVISGLRWSLVAVNSGRKNR